MRLFLFIVEALVFGPSYAFLQSKIRTPTPLDPEKTWASLSRPRHPVVEWISKHYPPRPVIRLLLSMKFRMDHIIGISHFYDISNDFYQLIFDKKYMFASCADFHQPHETLEEAQTNKAQFILALLQPQAGEKILELGCGWGAMLTCIYEVTGDRENLYGYTLSQEQVAYNEQYNHFQVELRDFITTTYPTAFYDKIYSIGAWEHVRPGEILPLTQKLYAALKPGGKMVHHFFCRLDEHVSSAELSAQIFFPGSIASPYRLHVQAFETAGFRITHRSMHDYRPTLRAWFDNLVANRDKALALVGPRTLNRYLVFFPVAQRYFAEGSGMLIRWVLEKPPSG